MLNGAYATPLQLSTVFLGALLASTAEIRHTSESIDGVCSVPARNDTISSQLQRSRSRSLRMSTALDGVLYTASGVRVLGIANVPEDAGQQTSEA